jgi:hypothetical protein
MIIRSPWVAILFAAALAAPLAARPAGAALQVAVTPNDVDEDDQTCFMHDTLSTQNVDVTNTGAAPVTATLYCSVPGQALRVAAITPPQAIAAGATARLQCSLFDFQDPPVDGSVVDFDVDVNGQLSRHAVTVRCRPHPSPAERCASARLARVARACGDRLEALAGYVETEDGAALDARLARSQVRLARQLARIERRGRQACDPGGALDPVLATLEEASPGILDRVGGVEPPGAAGDALRALAGKCRGDLGAWARFARRGDASRLEADLARSDARFERRFARAFGGADGERDWLRLAVEDVVESLAAGEALDVADRPAELLRAGVVFAAGEREKRLWLAMPSAGELLFDRAPDLHATLYAPDGSPLAVGGELPSALDPEAASLALPGPSGHLSLVLRRSGSLRRQRDVTALLWLDDPAAAAGSSLGFFSPLRSFPDGEDLYDLPVGSPFASFDDYVLGAWGYPLSEGRLAFEWFALQPLFYGLCPVGGPGATPPAGASHDQNECGISTFIHSMETTFPGALAPDVTTDPKKWDAVADTIGHRNWHGTPLLASQVNEHLSGARTQVDRIGPVAVGASKVAQPSGTRDGKFYCAGRVGDERPANLAAWAEDCNLKVLVFDLPDFAHWADVNRVTPDPNDASKATLQLQDYEKSYDVPCSHVAGTVLDTTRMDFGADPAAAGSVMRGNFDAADPVAGDDLEESVSFWVVCECDRTTPLDPKLPSVTKSGKPLAP